MTELNPSTFLFGGKNRPNKELISEEENFKDGIDNYEDDLCIRLIQTELKTPKFNDISSDRELL